jgi:hypothetical protein
MKRVSALVGFIVVAMGASQGMAQTVELKGQYNYEKKHEMSSLFVFDDDGVNFMAFRMGDMASIYSEGKFELKGNLLILHYDSTGVRKRVSKTHIVTPTGTDTLMLRNVTPKKFDLVLQPYDYVETYRKVKDALLKKK